MSLKAISELCPSCSGALEYKGKGVLKCPFCGGQYYSEERAQMDKDLKNDQADYEDEYEDGEELSEDEIADIVYEAVLNYAAPDGYGVQILEDSKKKSKLSKEDKARDNFEIPDDETIYMIFDETMFGSCKKGYAITDYGIHFTDEEDDLYFYPWDEFADTKLKLKSNIELKIGDAKISLTGGDAAQHTYDMLSAIKDQM